MQRANRIRRSRRQFRIHVPRLWRNVWMQSHYEWKFAGRWNSDSEQRKMSTGEQRNNNKNVAVYSWLECAWNIRIILKSFSLFNFTDEREKCAEKNWKRRQRRTRKMCKSASERNMQMLCASMETRKASLVMVMVANGFIMLHYFSRAKACARAHSAHHKHTSVTEWVCDDGIVSSAQEM